MSVAMLVQGDRGGVVVGVGVPMSIIPIVTMGGSVKGSKAITLPCLSSPSIVSEAMRKDGCASLHGQEDFCIKTLLHDSGTRLP